MFLPSDVARLVFGYLENEGLKETCDTFLNESVHLTELRTLKKKKAVKAWTGKSLICILEEYTAITDRGEKARRDGPEKTLNVLWKKLDQIVAQIKFQYRPSDHQGIGGRQNTRTRNSLSRLRFQQLQRDTDIKNSTSSDLLSTPFKEDLQLNSKSPRRKTILPKRREVSASIEDVNHEAVEVDESDLPHLLEVLLSNTELHEKLAENINKIVTSDGSSIDNNSHGNQPCSSDSMEDIFDIHAPVTNDAISDIIESTSQDPVFESLFSLFNVDKAQYIRELEESKDIQKQLDSNEPVFVTHGAQQQCQINSSVPSSSTTTHLVPSINKQHHVRNLDFAADNSFSERTESLSSPSITASKNKQTNKLKRKRRRNVGKDKSQKRSKKSASGDGNEDRQQENPEQGFVKINRSGSMLGRCCQDDATSMKFSSQELESSSSNIVMQENTNTVSQLVMPDMVTSSQTIANSKSHLVMQGSIKTSSQMETPSTMTLSQHIASPRQVNTNTSSQMETPSTMTLSQHIASPRQVNTNTSSSMETACTMVLSQPVDSLRQVITNTSSQMETPSTMLLSQSIDSLRQVNTNTSSQMETSSTMMLSQHIASPRQVNTNTSSSMETACTMTSSHPFNFNSNLVLQGNTLSQTSSVIAPAQQIASSRPNMNSTQHVVIPGMHRTIKPIMRSHPVNQMLSNSLCILQKPISVSTCPTKQTCTNTPRTLQPRPILRAQTSHLSSLLPKATLNSTSQSSHLINPISSPLPQQVIQITSPLPQQKRQLPSSLPQQQELLPSPLPRQQENFSLSHQGPAPLQISQQQGLVPSTLLQQRHVQSPSPQQEHVRPLLPQQQRQVPSPLPQQQRHAAPPLPQQRQAASVLPQQQRQVPTPLPQQQKQVPSPLPQQQKQSASPLPQQQRQVPSPLPQQQKQAASPLPQQQRQMPSPLPQQQRQMSSPLPQQQRQAASPLPQQQRQVASPLPQQQRQMPSSLPQQQKQMPSPLPQQQRKMPSPLPQQRQAASPLPQQQRQMPSSLPQQQKQMPPPLPQQQRQMPSPLPQQRQAASPLPQQQRQMPSLLPQQQRQVPSLLPQQKQVQTTLLQQRLVPSPLPHQQKQVALSIPQQQRQDGASKLQRILESPIKDRSKECTIISLSSNNEKSLLLQLLSSPEPPNKLSQTLASIKSNNVDASRGRTENCQSEEQSGNTACHQPITLCPNMDGNIGQKSNDEKNGQASFSILEKMVREESKARSISYKEMKDASQETSCNVRVIKYAKLNDSKTDHVTKSKTDSIEVAKSLVNLASQSTEKSVQISVEQNVGESDNTVQDNSGSDSGTNQVQTTKGDKSCYKKGGENTVSKKRFPSNLNVDDFLSKLHYSDDQ